MAVLPNTPAWTGKPPGNHSLGVMMLKYIGEMEAADKVAINQVLEEKIPDT